MTPTQKAALATVLDEGPVKAGFSGACFIKGRKAALTPPLTLPFSGVCGSKPPQPIIVIQDGARYHTSAETKAFFTQQAARLQVVQLPTYSPDYNPIEKLWKKIKQQDTPLQYFPTVEALTEKVEQALIKFANAPEEVLALCGLPTGLAQAA